MKFLFFGSLVLLVQFSVFSQNGIRFEAFADVNEVVVNQYFEVNFILNNASGRNFQPPSFRGFKVVSGPNRSSSTSIINGVVSKEQGYGYTLLATQVGEYIIGGATLVVNGKKMQTKPLTIRVVEAKKIDSASGELPEIFLRIEPSDSLVYVGQQVLLDYKIYTRKNIDSYNLLSEAKYAGFYPQEVRKYEGRPMREVVGGTTYTTQVLKRVSLFPQQAGNFTIDPMILQIGVVVDQPKDVRGFFFMRDVQYENLSSNPLQLIVKGLPPGAPSHFSGAVGHYEMTVQYGPPSITTDDALEVKLYIRGNGDPKRVLPPPLDFGAEFDHYPPKVVEEEFMESIGEWMHTSEMDYLAIPGKVGTFVLKPQFSYFDPDSARYKIISADSFVVTIHQGQQLAGNRGPGSREVTSESELLPLRKLDNSIFFPERLLFSPVFWIFLVIPFLWMAGVWVKDARSKAINRDKSGNMRRKASEIAGTHLQEAAIYLAEKSEKPFYEAVAAAIMGYACTKLNMPLAKLTKANVQEKLLELGVSDEKTKELLQVIQSGELALFAGVKQPEKMEVHYQKALQVIADIEMELKGKNR